MARVHDAPATQCDPGITAGLSEAAAASQPLLRRMLGAASAAAAAHQLAQQQQQQPTQPEPVAAAGEALAQQQQQRQGESSKVCAANHAADKAGSCTADTESGPPALEHHGGSSGGGFGARIDPEVPQPNPEVPRLVSGAGHDALAMADAGPMGMLFVRCRNGGISHSPAELVDAEDTAAAAAALLTYLHAELT